MFNRIPVAPRKALPFPAPVRTIPAMDQQAGGESSMEGATQRQAARDSETNVKETIESILIAFVLAFMFRAFVVEAFVIPTGSMAPTLLGSHLHFICEDCGYSFESNYTTGEKMELPSRSERINSIRCPNCGFKVPRTNPQSPSNAATNTPTRYGDRILVLKYAYLLGRPQRWDVVVFKTPDRPQEYDYSQNYIKRLIGLPGECVMILDGDIYAAPHTQGKDPLIEEFQIQRKPRAAQKALWRIVYDNDFVPRKLDRGWKDRDDIRHHEAAWEQPWKMAPGQRGWTINQSAMDRRELVCNQPEGSAEIYFDPTANAKTNSLTDWMAYDSEFWQSFGTDEYEDERYIGDNNVSDVMLEFCYSRAAGDGPLRLELSKLDHLLSAEITASNVKLFYSGKLVAAAEIPGGSSLAPQRVQFVNADYRASLRINGVELLAHEYPPDVRWLIDAAQSQKVLPKPSIRIAASKQSCTLSHVRLWRDTYYDNRHSRLNPGGGRFVQWASPDEFPRQVMRLKEDEYFVCGDNPPLSGDARSWNSPINLPHEDLFASGGRVPGRFMLGRAFFVYWPAGFRPLPSAPALVPNFGDMRFIR